MTDKVVGLNGKPVPVPDNTPVRTFEITTHDDTTYIEDGYVCVTPHFVAVADHEGNINFVCPLPSLKVLQVMPSIEQLDLFDSENPDLGKAD